MRHIFRILGILLCVLPPAVSTVAFFPIWLTNGRTALAALLLTLFALGAIPVLILFKRHNRPPALWMIWLFLWGFLFCLRPILPAIETIALISFPIALLGWICFRIGQHFERKSVKEG